MDRPRPDVGDDEQRDDAPERSSWAWELGSIAGIRLRIHASFLLLVAWVALVHFQQEPTWRSVAAGTAFLLAVFALVLGHELCHAFAARAFGIGTTDITLWPIGGVSRLERTPEAPSQELVVALAGPAFNLLLALLLGVWVVGSGGWGALVPEAAAPTLDAFAVDMLWANLILGVFNLLPAFPMDGGRVLRAGLSAFTGRARATRLAAGIAKGFAVLFGLAGLWLNPFLVIIAVLVWLGAEAEASGEGLREATRQHRVGQATVRPLRVLSPDEPLAAAADLLLRGQQRTLLVRGDDPARSSVLGEEDLMRALERLGADAAVGLAARPAGAPLHPQDSLEEALLRLQRESLPGVPVVAGREVVGVVTPGSIAALLRLSDALGDELTRVTDPPRARPTALVGGPQRSSDRP